VAVIFDSHAHLIADDELKPAATGTSLSRSASIPRSAPYRRASIQAEALT